MKRFLPLFCLVFAFITSQAHALDLFKKDDSQWQSQRFRNLDTNHDGKVTQEEYLHDNVEQFKNMDEDKNGTLSPDEVDFSPGTPAAAKPQLRKQMQDDEKRQAESMAQMRAEQEKAQKEAIEASKKAAESVAKTKPPAIETAPKPVLKPADKTVPKIEAKPVATPAPAAAKAPAATPSDDGDNQ